MKIQHLAVIFILIILPISLVVGEYIQTQIDTITLQSMYSQKLQDATYDAMKAFQINTINNKYSSLSDSKIRDIEAAITTFHSSIATSLGGDNSIDSVRDYIPAILFTMYDGYYIYGKYFDYNEEQYKYGLKPYIYYSCKYNYNNKEYIINYSLDNSITVYGELDGKYGVWSGYVINYNSIGNETTRTVRIKSNDGDTSKDFDYTYPISIVYDGVRIERELLTENLVAIREDGSLTTSTGDSKGSALEYQYIKYGNQKIYKEINSDIYFILSNNRIQRLSDEGKILGEKEMTPLRYAQAMTEGTNMYSNSAVQYFKEAKEFSMKVNNNLGGLTQNHAIDNKGNKIANNKTTINGKEEEYFSNNIGNKNIFNFSSTNDPLVLTSDFNEHRMSVIRKSIETNLQSAIANYNDGASGSHLFQMPKLNEEDWEKLLNNISLSVFMQGLPIKAKTFNSYAIITNDSNEEVVTEDSIYIVAKNNNTGKTEVHFTGCTDLWENGSNYQIIKANNILDFRLQTVTISEDNEVYYYPALGNGANQITYCYNCIVNSTDTYDINQIISGEIKSIEKNGKEKYINTSESAIRKEYLKALARERYDLYRTNKNL